MKTNSENNLRVVGCLFALVSCGVAELYAQNNEDDVVELSPFTVDGSGDDGYYATETTSGTQLRTSLRSLANPITVLTEELLADIGANSYERAVDFLPSTVSYVGDASDNDGNSARTGTAYTARGFRVNSLTENFLSTNIRQDNFNTERLTQSRGPNSLLFGLGSVGGAMNSGSKRGLTNMDHRRFEFQTDNFGSQRAVVDLNKVLIDDKLALRVALLYDDKRTFRDLEFRRRKSGYANITYNPFKRTQINANVEWGKVDEISPRLWLTKDWYTAWANNPLPDIQKANTTDLDLIRTGSGSAKTAAQNDVIGTSRGFSSNGYIVHIVNEGVNYPVMSWARKSKGDYPLVNGNRPDNVSIVDPQLTPDIYYPLANIPSGPTDAYDTDYLKYSLTLEQQLFENTYLQLAYGHEGRDVHDFRPVKRQNYAIQVDNNYYLPIQRKADNPDLTRPLNPFFGLPYLESSQELQDSFMEMEQYRANLSHQIQFGKNEILGNINIVGSYYERHSNSNGGAMDEMNMVGVNPNGTFTGNFTQQNINRRYYLMGDNPSYFPATPLPVINQLADFSYGSHRGTSVTAPGAQIVPEVRSAFVHRLEPNINYDDTVSKSILGQWSLLKDRVILTGGIRQDDLTSDRAVVTRDSVTGFWLDLDSAAYVGDPDVASAKNSNYGIVVKAHRKFDFYANVSTNTVSAGSSAYTVFNELVPDQEGEGWDAGLRTFFLDDKLVLKLNYFENELLNMISNPLRDGAAIGIGLARENSVVERFLDGMVYNGYGATVAASPRFIDYPGTGLWTDVENTLTTGYEFEMIFNPTSNFRMMLNVTKNDTAVNETFVTFRPWYDEFVAPVEGNAGILNLVANPGISETKTLGQIVAEMQRKLQFHEAQVGGKQVRSNTWKANAVGSYNFSNDSKLKGYRIGGSVRWKEAPSIGYAEINGEFQVDQPLFGLTSFIADAFITKAWRAKDDGRWETTLRVRNVLNDNGWYPNTAIDDGTGNPYYLQQIFLSPRSYELSFSLRY
jgi:hypothetical protein